MLDLGCGFGWHCIYAAERGARRVVGVDLSQRMLAVAREKTSSSVVEYVRMPIEDIDYAPDTFDVVLSSLAFHYVADWGAMCARVARCLACPGDFVFSCEHPVFTAYGTQDWCYGPEGEKLHWPVDRYFTEGAREAVFLGERIVKYHRTVTTIVSGLTENGFQVKTLAEPLPTTAMLEKIPGMADELRRPMMLIVAAKKTTA